MSLRWKSVVLLACLLPIWAAGVSPPPPDSTAEAVTLLARDIPGEWSVQRVSERDQTLTVCLDLPVETLLADHGLGVEVVEETVRRALTPLSWRSLHVSAVDPTTGDCRPLSDFLPRVASASAPQPAVAPVADRSLRTTGFPRSLEGKTVYVSAGHGWQWNSWAWRTQRVVYEGFIEDHNNAEAVDQYLIPYLESAGATVIPVRERDWNTSRVIVDNDAGAPAYVETGSWSTGVVTGYAGGIYRFAATATGAATAAATWTLTAAQPGDYALYAWVRPGANRAPDAHYTVHHAAGTTEVRLDQRIRPQTWRYLGTYPFYAGTVTVTLDNASSQGGAVVIADALRLGGGIFDDLTGIATTAPAPPGRPWWESATFYYSQWMGLNPDDWPDFNDVIARPIFSRWNHAGSGEDAVYLSWHTNGYNGTARGTESYVHNEETYPRTEGSVELQQAVHDELIHDIRAGWDATWTDRGKKQANLGEVRMLWDDDPATRMPGVLFEIAFHDHPDDANALKDPRFNQLAARAIYQGIVHYFETRDGVALTLAPEPPTHLRVQNLGGGAVRVAWSASPTDAVGLRGDAAAGYRIYTSPDGFAWGAPVPVAGVEHTLTGLTPGQTLYVRVTAVNDGGESFPTEVLGARVGAPSLLIVNGFDKINRFGLVVDADPAEGDNLRMWLDRINRRDYVVHHGGAAPADYAWDSASNEAVADGLAALDDYPMVDWILGEEAEEEDGTLNAAERAALQGFIANDGALLISGSELAWDLESGGRDPDFLHQTLHTDYITDDANTYTVTPAAGGAFDGLADFPFDAPGEYDADYPDVIAPLSGATSALNYAGGTGGTAAVQYGTGCRRLLVLGFPLETVRPEVRGNVVARALAFLDECALTDTEITTPQAGGYYSTTPAFAGSATGVGITEVQVRVQRDRDGAYWNGASWAGETWLLATGTLSWSYGLPALSDDAYTLWAQAVATPPDPTPAEVGFVFDGTPPLTPTLITPTGGAVLRTPVVALKWTAPDDGGAPLTYEVDITGETYLTAETVYTVSLNTGVYVWRVRARDAAGNVGAWSDTAEFEVDVQQVYLPLVLRNYEAGSGEPEVLLDSGFETEDGWAYHRLAVRVSDEAHGGSWSARVGIPPGEAGAGEVIYSSISRALTLPCDVAKITLRYWIFPIAEAGDSGDMHYVSVVDGVGALHTLFTLTVDTRAWEARTLDLTAYAGQAITLYFGVKNDGDADTAASYLDDVRVEVVAK